MPATFPHGRLAMTPGARDTFTDEERLSCLRRHLAQDWGDLDADDRRANERALASGERLFSAYDLRNDRRMYIITEADRSVTTLLLPNEY